MQLHRKTSLVTSLSVTHSMNRTLSCAAAAKATEVPPHDTKSSKTHRQACCVLGLLGLYVPKPGVRGGWMTSIVMGARREDGVEILVTPERFSAFLPKGKDAVFLIPQAPTASPPPAYTTGRM